MIKGRRGRCFLLSMWALLGALLVGLAPRSLALAAEPPPAGVQPAPAPAAAKAATALEEEPPPAGAQAPAAPQGAQQTPPAAKPAPVEDPEPPPAPLLSEPPQPGETAASYVQRSVQYFGSKEYENAALALEKAYKIDPKPLFLFNIGQAYKRAGRPKEALAAYERFLRADPQSTLRAEAEGYCNDMRSLIAEQERSAQVKAALLTEKERAAEKEAALRAEKLRTEQTQKALLAERAKAERERRRPIYKRPWFWGVVGGGVLAAGLAIGLGVALAPRDRETEGGFVDINFALSR